MNDERIEGRPVFSCENFASRLRIQSVGTKAVNCLRRNGYQIPPPQIRRSNGYIMS